MKILMVAPSTGGIDVYVQALAQKIREYGHVVDITGSTPTETAYNSRQYRWKTIAQAVHIAEKIVRRTNFGKYDLVVFHFGKNDVEQYIPVYLKENGISVNRPTYFVHYLTRNLFSDYLHNKKLQEEVEKAVYSFFEYYIFFGSFAKKYMESKVEKPLRSLVTFLPETHSWEKLSQKEKEQFRKIFIHPEVAKRNLPLVILPGFPAHYKDFRLLLNAVRLTKQPFGLLFAGFGWQKKLQFTEKQVGNTFVYVVEKYLSPREFNFLVQKSLFGVFPYRQPNDRREVFQGSGTLPNFIYNGTATIVLNEASLPEYVGPSGIILPRASAHLLADAIDTMLDSRKRLKFEKQARKRRHFFSMENHARSCLRFFSTILGAE